MDSSPNTQTHSSGCTKEVSAVFPTKRRAATRLESIRSLFKAMQWSGDLRSLKGVISSIDRGASLVTVGAREIESNRNWHKRWSESAKLFRGAAQKIQNLRHLQLPRGFDEVHRGWLQVAGHLQQMAELVDTMRAQGQAHNAEQLHVTVQLYVAEQGLLEQDLRHTSQLAREWLEQTGLGA